VAAGVYQVTPLKDACLTHCRTPFAFVAAHWQPGVGGAFRMGLHHGLFCVGCCWVLMVLLFVGGVMNLLWIAAIAGFVLLEKALPLGTKTGRVISGLGLMVAGSWFLVF
jgi:predicted metal-binding membrane protein